MRRLLGALWIAATCVAVRSPAQSKPDANPAPCTVAPQPAPCGAAHATPGRSNAPQKFPFPGDPAAPSPAPAAATPSLTGGTDAPAPPDTTTPPSASKKFPFPGEAGTPPTGDASSPGANRDAAGQGSSSSSSSSSSSGDTPQYDPNAPAPTPAPADQGSTGGPPMPGRHILHRVNPVGTKLQSADEREGEDLDVARFYLQSGDLKGAYLRGQDAVKAAPDDPDAHLLLAEAALKLNKRDEAIAEYGACLRLDPTQRQAKDARKALDRLKP